MNFLYCLLLVLAPLNLYAVHIEESQAVDQQEQQEQQNLQFKDAAEVDEADELITNRRLRADTGSLSPWSVSIFTNYQGGSVAHPIDPERPNIVAGNDATTMTLQNLTGTVGIRYRFTAKDSLTLNVGFFMTTPFHSSITTDNESLRQSFNDNSQKLDINDPELRYVHLNKIFGVQSVTELNYRMITNGQQRDRFDTRYFISQTFMKDVGDTGFGYGSHFTFTNHELTHPVPDGQATPVRSMIGIYPFLEYEINDTYNLRTVWGWQVLDRFKSESNYQKRKVYQSVGLGISVTRDIFLYPNIQFIPSDMRADRTNIAVSANINVF